MCSFFSLQFTHALRLTQANQTWTHERTSRDGKERTQIYGMDRRVDEKVNFRFRLFVCMFVCLRTLNKQRGKEKRKEIEVGNYNCKILSSFFTSSSSWFIVQMSNTAQRVSVYSCIECIYRKWDKQPNGAYFLVSVIIIIRSDLHQFIFYISITINSLRG